MTNLFAAVLSFLFFFSLPSFAQGSGEETTASGGEYAADQNDARHPCITSQQYEMIEKQCGENIKLLGLDKGAQRGTQTTLLNWPLRAAAGLLDCNFYYLSAGVDHNPASGAITDYHCGTNTYDGHGGTDLSIWPFNFYKMGNDLVEVIAAAPGTILYKSDGHFDRNCTANSDTANYIIIRHADGSQANYWHMKKNSVTAKTVGQTVVAGEYLGVVGSSGSSSGPHLHFEVWSGSTNATRVDPFAGNCNSLNASSWWVSQKPYAETAVSKASVNTTDIVVPACPATETLNESTVFEIPFQGAGLSPGYARFYAFITYDSIGTTVNLSILNPNGTTFNSWTYNNSAAYYKTSYRGWSKLLPTTPGTYTFKAEYNGTVCSQSFDIISAASVALVESPSSIKVYPNPSNGTFMIEFENGNRPAAERMIEIYNVLGEKVFQTELSTNQSELNLNVQSGMYFYKVKDNGKYVSSGKLMVE